MGAAGGAAPTPAVNRKRGKLVCTSSPLLVSSAGWNLPAAGPALLLEAVVAVHRLVAARQEWHFGLLAAVGARYRVHLALAAEAAPAAAAAAATAPRAVAATIAIAVPIAVPTAIAIPLAVAAAASATAL